MKNHSLLGTLNRFKRSLCLLSLLILAFFSSAQAQDSTPEGTLGWTYYAGLFVYDAYAADPVSACEKTAKITWGRHSTRCAPWVRLATGTDANTTIFWR